MNKILLLGHPSCELEQVEALLRSSGMDEAQPSRREGLLPRDITDILCQADACPDVHSPTTEAEFEPRQVGTVWHGLALDLMLGNLKQSVWGWHDPRTIFWLDYWASLDPNLTFVMVYDHPGTALRSMAPMLAERGLDMEGQRLLENWQAYNGAMLRFHTRHPSRCLLVHARRVRKQLDDYLAELSDKLPSRHTTSLRLEGSVPPEGGDHQGTSTLGGDLSLALAAAPSTDVVGLTDWFHGSTTLDEQLLDEWLRNHPLALQIYAELEAACTVAGSDDAPLVHPGQAWIDLVRYRQATVDLVLNFYRKNEAQSSEIAAFNHQMAQLQQALETSETARQAVQGQLEAEISQARDAKAAASESLRRLRLELEQHQQAARRAQVAPPHPAGAPELEEENRLLLEQLHAVQEEMERYYLENLELRKRTPTPPARPYGAAQRIRRQLSYRLGSTMIAHSRNWGGWMRMPAALVAEVRAYRADLRRRGDEKLPPIRTYADAHEADRLRKHLSYRLGQTLLKHGKTPWGWLVLPFALASTVKAFRKTRA